MVRCPETMTGVEIVASRVETDHISFNSFQRLAKLAHDVTQDVNVHCRWPGPDDGHSAEKVAWYRRVSQAASRGRLPAVNQVYTSCRPYPCVSVLHPLLLVLPDSIRGESGDAPPLLTVAPWLVTALAPLEVPIPHLTDQLLITEQ